MTRTVGHVSRREKWLKLTEDERLRVRKLEFAEAIGNRLAQRRGRWRSIKISPAAILRDHEVLRIVSATLRYSEFSGVIEREALARVATRIVLREAPPKIVQGGQFERNRRKH